MRDESDRVLSLPQAAAIIYATGKPTPAQTLRVKRRLQCGLLRGTRENGPSGHWTTTTRNVAEYARRELLEESNFGTVEAGNRADLLLLRANPFDDLEALWDQEGIMVRGRWMDREEMDSLLADLREKTGD